MNYPFPNCNSDRRTGKIVGAFLLVWIMGLLPAYAQTAQSPYIGNDSLRIIPLKESVLYLTQWNRLELQSTLYGKDYKPVIMQVSGAKYRMDEKEKNVLWMMPDSGSQKVTLRVGKYMKNGIAFKVKDFEFKVMSIKLKLQIWFNGKLLEFNSKEKHRIEPLSSVMSFKVMPDSNMVKQCPETGNYKYYVGRVTFWGITREPYSFNLTHTDSLVRRHWNIFYLIQLIDQHPAHIWNLDFFKLNSDGVSTKVNAHFMDKYWIIPFVGKDYKDR